MAYWDTSCLLKLYAPEPDSDTLKAHVVAGATLITSEIARLELWAALRRKEAAGDLSPGGARLALRAFDEDIDAGRVSLLPVEAGITSEYESVVDRCHSTVPPLPLRTLDAIHLATGRVSGESQIVTTDVRLRTAALMLA